MAECHNNVFVLTRDNRCVLGSGCEFQKCAQYINGKRCGEQCKHNTLESERSIGTIRLSRRQPLVPIEPIVKSKTPIFINDIVRRKRRLYNEPETAPQSLKSHVLREFKFAARDEEEEEDAESVRDGRFENASKTITHCFTTTN